MRLVLTLPFVLAMGCSGQQVPDPRTAANAYAAAAARGDSDAIYGMMTGAAQKERSKEDVRKIVLFEREELAEQATALRSKDARIEATARLSFEDGEEAALDLRNGRFWVTSAGALPRTRARPPPPRRRPPLLRRPHARPLPRDPRGDRAGSPHAGDGPRETGDAPGPGHRRQRDGERTRGAPRAVE